MRLKAAIIVLMILVLLCPVALAEDAESDTEAAKNWEWSLAPMYLWAASISGDMTVKGIKVDVDESFSDIVSNLDGALMFHFEGVHKQRLGPIHRDGHENITFN